MKFLCGRPGCGQESTATLQIDAVSSTVSLVDPRTSREGVPLCPRHADSTTPPVGWAMNDLRTTARVLGGSDGEPGISSTPPRVRPEVEPESPVRQQKMPRRQSISERARRDVGAEDQDELDELVTSAAIEAEAENPASEAVSDEALFDEQLLNAKLARRAARRPSADRGPNSRPSRRRDTADDDSLSEDRFPWNFQFDDDEPEELQASTPLLSRAFRATTG